MKEILMPALSPTMEDGKIVNWIKKEGDKIKSGDVVFEIETDKAVMEYEATDEGTLGKILYPAGSEGVKVGVPVGLLLAEGESADVLSSYTPSASSASSAPKEDLPPVSFAPSMQPQGEVKAPAFEVPAEEVYNGPKKVMTVREALNITLLEEMRKDNTMIIMGEEVAQYQGAYKVTQGLVQEFGDERVIDTPITEYGFAGMGVGAAFAGVKVIAEFMTFNFAMQAIDHIVNSAAKHYYMSGGEINCPIVFRGPNGPSARVSSQHSQCFAAWYSSCPGLIVLAPYSSEDSIGLLRSAIRNPNPVVFLENEVLYGMKFEAPEDSEFSIPIGKAKIEKSGDDVTIISFSRGMHFAMEGAKELANQGINAEVINLRSLRPLDMDTIVNSIKKTNKAIIVEQGWATCGIGAEIIAQVNEKAFDYLDAPLIRVTGKDVPMPYADNLEKFAMPSKEDVVEAAKKLCNK